MALPSKSNLCLLGLLLISSLSSAQALAGAELSSEEPTAYELLQGFDFPMGILPQGVRGYVLRKHGYFELYLKEDCDFQVSGGYTLRYKKKVSGTVASGSLSNLSGVSVKVLFLFIGINDVVRDGDDLRFYVGPLSTSFPVSNFLDCPRCHCGFDCVTASEMVSDA